MPPSGLTLIAGVTSSFFYSLLRGSGCLGAGHDSSHLMEAPLEEDVCYS